MINIPTSSSLKIVICAGEMSGEQRASELVDAIRQIRKEVVFKGMAGPLLRAKGVEAVVDSETVGGVMGFSELFGKLKGIVKAYFKIKKLIKEWRPDLLILVDFPDFNMRLAKVARDEGVATFYYIPPKVWAWRSRRIKQFKDRIDAIAAIFPFECDFHRKRAYDRTFYVGHPFTHTFGSIQKQDSEFRETRNIPPDSPILALLPGSRSSEVKRHWQIQLDCFNRIIRQYPNLHAIAVVPNESLANDLRANSLHKQLSIEVGSSKEVLIHSNVGILKSGTCTLEAAFIGLPFACIYKASRISAFLAKRLLSISEVSLVNIVRPNTVREFLQSDCTAEKITKEVVRLINDSNYRSRMVNGFREVRGKFDPITKEHLDTNSEEIPKNFGHSAAKLALQTARPARQSSSELYSRLYRYLTPYRPTFIVALICMVVFGATDGVVPFLVKEVLDKVFQASDSTYLYLFPLFLISLSVLRAAADFGQQYLMSRVGHSVVRDIRSDMNDKFLALGPEFFIRNSSADMLSRITGDVLLTRTLLTDSLASVLRDSIRIVALGCVAVWMDPTLAFIAIIFVPVGFLPIYHVSKKLRELGRRGQDGVGALTARLQESILGNKVVKIFCNDEFERERFSEANKKLTGIFIKSDRIKALGGPINEIMASLAIAAVILYGGTSVLGGVRSQGAFIGFLIAIFLLYDPFKKISRVHTSVQQSLASASRIFDVLDTNPTIIEPEDALPAPVGNSVHFEDLSYLYPGSSKLALSSVNLTIKEGSKVAIVGLSGSGKSTLVDFIPRFIDPSIGAVYIGGVDVKKISLKSLRHKIAVVGQHTFLFNDSIWNNIRYGNHSASSEEVLAAASKAHAAHFIEALPDRYETLVGEGGFALSGGERQRIAIARAILKNSPILVLDEATASLDNRSEREVQSALSLLMEGKTTIVIAHRLSTIIDADEIIVMKEGAIIERGGHKDLLDKGGEYAMLHSLQFTTPPKDK